LGLLFTVIFLYKNYWICVAVPVSAVGVTVSSTLGVSVCESVGVSVAFVPQAAKKPATAKNNNTFFILFEFFELDNYLIIKRCKDTTFLFS
jgi:hypothetical protein